MITKRNLALLIRRLRVRTEKNKQERAIVADVITEISGWPEWKQRAALGNYKFGKEDAE